MWNVGFSVERIAEATCKADGRYCEVKYNEMPLTPGTPVHTLRSRYCIGLSAETGDNSGPVGGGRGGDETGSLGFGAYDGKPKPGQLRE